MLRFLMDLEGAKRKEKGYEKNGDQSLDLGVSVSFFMGHNRVGGRFSAKADSHDHSLERGGRK